MKMVQPLRRGRLRKLLLKEQEQLTMAEVGNQTNDEQNQEPALTSEPKTMQGKHSVAEHDYSSDSGASSVEDHLVDPETLNLDECFFSPTYQSQPMDAEYPADSIDEMEVYDGELPIDDSAANAEREKMYQIFSQITDFERRVNQANACVQSWETKVNEIQDQVPMAVNIPTVLSQAKDWLHHNASNEDDPDWESLDVRPQTIEETKNIEIFVSNTFHKAGRVLDVAQSLKRLEQERRKRQYLEVHKVHLLLLLAYGIQVNRLVNSSVIDFAPELYDLIANSDLSIPEKDTLSLIKSILDFYKENVKLATKKNSARTVKIKKGIRRQLIAREASCRKMYNVMLLTLLRYLSIRARLVVHLDVVPKSPPIMKAAPKSKMTRPRQASTEDRYRNVPLTTMEILKRKPEIQKMFQLTQLDGADGDAYDEELPTKKVCMQRLTRKPRLWKLQLKTNVAPPNKSRDKTKEHATSPISIQLTTDQQPLKLISSKFFRKRPSSKQHPAHGKLINKTETIGGTNVSNEKPNLSKLIMHKTASVPNEGVRKKKHRVPQLDTWIECFLESEQRWTVVEAVLGDVDCMDRVIDLIQDPPIYVFAWEPSGTIVDVSERYWWRNEPMALKQRVDRKWLKKAYVRYRPLTVDIALLLEQLEFRQLKFRAPIPTTIAQFKSHPSYCLKRDLQKFQGIFPPEAPPLGFIHGEPIYARECVHTLHSREVWLRHAKIIRMNELPYKIVKSKLRREQTNLELFGYWQTEDYIPPEPIDGVVPRNAYGNIEIFKDCMLPKGTVHLKQFGLSYVCRKLGIDYAVAVVGFGVHAGGNHPVFDGIVICEEHRDRLLEAWEIHQEESAKKKEQKKQQLVLKNWVKLVKGVIVRRKLQHKYNFDGM